MALSEQELNALREIERSLMADDPRFSASMTGHGNSHVNFRGITFVAFGILILILGVVLSQTSWWFLILSVCGFLLMFFSSVWMLKKGKGIKKEREESDFGLKVEDRFYKRFQE